MSIDFSILGCGNIGTRHAERIAENPRTKLIGVFDIDSAKRETLAEQTGASSFSSIDELLSSDAKVVSICTPSGLHMKHAVQCLEAGKHVLVEKPLALSSADGEAMLNAAERNQCKLFVVKQNRYNPPVQRVKSAIDAGKLGKVFQVVVNCYWNRNEQYYSQSNWKGSKDLDGGVLYNQFSHFIDILYYLFGGINKVQGQTANFNHRGITEFEDSGSFVFEFLQGGMGSLNFTTNAYAGNMEGSISIFAERGTVKIGGKYLNAIEYIKAEELTADNLPLSAPANDYGHYEGSMSNHDKVIENVVEAILGEGAIMTPARDGIEVVKMIEQFYAAANDNG